MVKYKLLDLFCGQGGAAVGYSRAGFRVEGVDNITQPKYPFVFHLSDALKYLKKNWEKYDAFHASPPCQAHTKARHIWGRNYVCYINDIRKMLKLTGKPYIIENVPGSPLQNPAILSGGMFGLRVIRRRLFETNWMLFTPPDLTYTGTTNSHRGMSKGGNYITVAGHNFKVNEASEAMGIDWMDQKGLSQAIPPDYTEWVGHQLILRLEI